MKFNMLTKAFIFLLLSFFAFSCAQKIEDSELNIDQYAQQNLPEQLAWQFLEQTVNFPYAKGCSFNAETKVLQRDNEFFTAQELSIYLFRRSGDWVGVHFIPKGESRRIYRCLMYFEHSSKPEVKEKISKIVTAALSVGIQRHQ